MSADESHDFFFTDEAVGLPYLECRPHHRQEHEVDICQRKNALAVEIEDVKKNWSQNSTSYFVLQRCFGK